MLLMTSILLTFRFDSSELFFKFFFQEHPFIAHAGDVNGPNNVNVGLYFCTILDKVPAGVSLADFLTTSSWLRTDWTPAPSNWDEASSVRNFWTLSRLKGGGGLGVASRGSVQCCSVSWKATPLNVQQSLLSLSVFSFCALLPLSSLLASSVLPF